MQLCNGKIKKDFALRIWNFYDIVNGNLKSLEIPKLSTDISNSLFVNVY